MTWANERTFQCDSNSNNIDDDDDDDDDYDDDDDDDYDNDCGTVLCPVFVLFGFMKYCYSAYSSQ